MKVGQIERNAILPKLLPDADVPAEIFFRLQIRVVAENLILTARRTEPRRNARVQRCVCLVDFVAARDSISPDTAELIEMIETPAGDEDQILDRRQRRLHKAGDLLSVVADEGWLWPERLRNERALLSCVDAAIKKS